MKYLLDRLLYIFLVIVEVVLLLRFVLRLFAANASVGFVQWVYQTSDELLAPFRGIFPDQVFKSAFVLDLTTVFAMIIYAVLVMVLLYIVDLVTPPYHHATVVKKK